MLTVVNDDAATRDGSLIDEIVREGARRMLAAALEAEVNQYIVELAAETDERGRRMVVRNGHHRPRTGVTPAGPVEVTAPRVNDRRIDEATGERKRFSSKILPPWCHKSPKVSEVLPMLYLHGLSSGDFVPALEKFPAVPPRATARHARPGTGRRRRRDGTVAGAGRGVPRRPPSAVLGSHGPKCHQRPAEVRATGRDEGDAGDLSFAPPRLADSRPGLTTSDADAMWRRRTSRAIGVPR